MSDNWTDWFWETLSSMGVISQTARLLFVGLDNGGKTVLVHLMNERPLAPPTTSCALPRQFRVGSVLCSIIELGGRQQFRKIWYRYFAGVQAVCYVVDASDHNRFEEAKEVLKSLLSAPELKNVPFLILGNKIDLPEAASEEELCFHLDLHNLTGKGKYCATEERQIEVFMCSFVRRVGYRQGIEWLMERMEKCRHSFFGFEV